MMLMSVIAAPLAAREPIPDKLVVLTFDDGCKSHFTVVRPILKKHQFGATFFITEGFDFRTNKTQYMSWEEIAQLHREGFEIGNHTRDHMALGQGDSEKADALLERIKKQLESISQRCREHDIPRPITFAYPGNGIDFEALPILKELDIQFARRGGAPEYPYEEGKGVAYEPGLDHPLLIPSAGDARPNWELANFKRAVDLCDSAALRYFSFTVSPTWLMRGSTRPPQSSSNICSTSHRTTSRSSPCVTWPGTSIRAITPRDPEFVITERKRTIASGGTLDNFRRPKDDADLRYWLQNMVWHHRFTPAEIRAATGMTMEEVTEALDRFDIRPETKPQRSPDHVGT